MDHSPPVKSTTSWTVWGRICRILVGVVFLVVAAGKIKDPRTFAEQIQSFQMAPESFTNAMANLLPWLEAVCSLLLITGVWRREARVLVLLMLGMFLCAKFWAEYFDLKITCGCFGSWLSWFDKATEGRPGIVLDFGLIAALVVDWVADCRSSRRTVAPGPTAPA